jgi:hypothetical protein
MPVNSRDVQFGAAIGFIVIVGIVAIYFGFSTKFVLALLAGLGILFCASLVEGYVRAAMLGTGALLLLLIAYDLATSCDSACHQSRAQAAQQRAAQEQARLAAEQARLASQSQQVNPHCNWKSYLITLTPDKQTALDPDNPDILGCKQDITFVATNTPSRCFYVRVMGEERERNTKYCDKDGALLPLKDVVSMRSADGPLLVKVTLEPPLR